jgi:hypothetical protein
MHIVLIAVIHLLVGTGIGGTVEYFLAKKKFGKVLTAAQKEFTDHLDAMKDKSEIMIRHDAQVFRDRLGVK